VDDVETPEQLTALLHSELYDKIDPATYGVSR
jgi:hypothetical protein